MSKGDNSENQNARFVTFGLNISPQQNMHYHYASLKYEGESISNQPISFPMGRDGRDFHTLFQYMFYTWV